MKASTFTWGLGIPLAVASLVSAEDWPQWRGSDRTGAAASSPPLIDSLPSEGLLPVWKSEPIKSGKDGGWGSPSVADGRVYLFAHEREQLRELGPMKYPWLEEDKRGGMTAEQYAEYEAHRRDEDQERAKAFAFREHVYCFDAETGATIWHKVSDSIYSRFPQSGSPTIVDGKLYILGAGRVARCLDVKDGNQLWETRLPGDFRDEFYQSSVLVIGDVAVLVAGRLFGLNIETGKIIWEGDPKQLQGTHSSPVRWDAPSGPKVIMNLASGHTACIEPSDGYELWRIKTDGGLATPIIVGDRLITYGNSRQKGMRCYRLTPTGAEELWQYHGTQDKGSSPTVVGDYIYVQGERRIACVSLADGTAAWSDNLDLASPQYTSLIAADEKVFYAYDGLTGFKATPDGYEMFLQAKFNAEGLMAPEAHFRQVLKLDEIEKEPNGLEQSMRLMEQKVNKFGPLKCATPAVADGRLYMRMPGGISCYDLRTLENSTVPADASCP